MRRLRSWSLVAISGGLVAAATLRLPYGYYLLLRLWLCGVALYGLSRSARWFTTDQDKWLLGGLVVLYNPLIPIRIGDKTLWMIVNIATVAYFWFLQRRAHHRYGHGV